jgi:hypothetical protein
VLALYWLKSRDTARLRGVGSKGVDPRYSLWRWVQFKVDRGRSLSPDPDFELNLLSNLWDESARSDVEEVRNLSAAR